MLDTRSDIFVLTAHRDHESYSSSTEVVGVYTRLKDAQIAMKLELKKEQADWEEDTDINMDDVEIKEETMRASVYDGFGGLEYTEFEIWVKKLTA